MRLLVCTQKVDKKDTTLGFFHTWIAALAKEYEEVSVVCLEKGEYDLPENVSVYSLGKEEGKSRSKYLSRFYGYIVHFHTTYDAVFVHMNQEYVLLGGLYWKFLGKPVYLWRNHAYGNVFTRIAVGLSTKVFCTSPSSFTARFKKTVVVPAGVDTSLFLPIPGIVRTKYSVCMVGRVSPVKHVYEALEAMQVLIAGGTQVSLTIIGDAPEKDIAYMNMLTAYVVENNLSSRVKFEAAVEPSLLPSVYSSHDICLNLTDTGSFDKTIVEAAACGAVPIVSNISLAAYLPPECITERTPKAIAAALQTMCEAHVRVGVQKKLEDFVAAQSLDALMQVLVRETSHV